MTAQPTEEAWDHDRMCRIAHCRVNADRRPIAEVARDLGVSETTLAIMVDRGRHLSEQSVAKKAKPMALVRAADRDEEQRRKDFAEQMRQHRKVTS